jgi:hypothetical protein
MSMYDPPCDLKSLCGGVLSGLKVLCEHYKNCREAYLNTAFVPPCGKYCDGLISPDVEVRCVHSKTCVEQYCLNELDTAGTDCPICPYCGRKDEHVGSILNKSGDWVRCVNCDCDFWAEEVTSTTYTTVRI